MGPSGVARGATASEAEMPSMLEQGPAEKIRYALYVQKAAELFSEGALLDRHRRRQQDEATPPSAQVSISTDHLKQQKKRYSNYSLMTLLFMVTMFAEYLLSYSAPFSVTKVLLTIGLAALFLIDAALLKMTAVKWGNALVCFSWFLLVLLLYILLLSFQKDYGYAILPVPLPIVFALLQYKLQPGGGQRSNGVVESRESHNMEAGTDNANEADEHANRTHDEEEKLFNYIFKLSSGIVNCGSLISMLLGHYMIRQVNAAVHFFFFTIVLGLYLMMVTTVRITILTRHATYLTILLKGLLLITVITVVIHGVNK